MNRTHLPTTIRPPKDCVLLGEIRTKCPVYVNTQLAQTHQRAPVFRKLWSEHKRSRYMPHDGGGRR